MVKAQCFESCEVHSHGFESRRWNHKPTVNSAVHPSEVGKGVLRSNSGATSTGHTLITANPKLNVASSIKIRKIIIKK